MRDKRTYSSEVANDSSYYETIWSSKKSIDFGEIILKEPTSHSCTLQSIVAVCRKLDNAEMSMDVRGHWNHIADYSFRLFDKKFMKCAIGRLDVVGGAHDNVGMDLPLKSVRVHTPHFHKFNRLGFEYAYRTHEIDQYESCIKGDRSFGLKCFLDEENIEYQGCVKLMNESLLQPANDKLEDPLKGVEFK
jgi:hypothetical protein